MSKRTTGITGRPKIGFKTIILNNWFVIKILIKANPLGVFLCALERFRTSVMIFFEHLLRQKCFSCVRCACNQYDHSLTFFLYVSSTS